MQYIFHACATSIRRLDTHDPMMHSVLVRWFAAFAPSPVAVRWPERFSSCLRRAARHCVHRRDDASAARTGSEHSAAGRADGRFRRAAVRGPRQPAGAAVVHHRRQPRLRDGRRRLRDLDRRPGRCGRARRRLAICAMFALRCVHPPSGAVALTAVLGGPADAFAGLPASCLSRLRCSRSRCSAAAIVLPRAHRTPLSARREVRPRAPARRRSVNARFHPRRPRSWC